MNNVYKKPTKKQQNVCFITLMEKIKDFFCTRPIKGETFIFQVLRLREIKNSIKEKSPAKQTRLLIRNKQKLSPKHPKNYAATIPAVAWGTPACPVVVLTATVFTKIFIPALPVIAPNLAT